MILIDNVLKQREAENNPIKVALIGCGEMSKGMINQITRYTPGMRVAAVYNRTVEKVVKAFEYAGISEYKEVNTLDDYADSVRKGVPVITQDISLLTRGEGCDIIVEVTGTIDFALRAILDAFDHGKHVLSFNAELDATLGPLLKYKAQRAGVMYSLGDGDQPGVTLNLYRFVKGMGFNPVLCGNIKGLQDHYRNPTTQKGFAASWDMTPEMVTSFADGTKISFEQAAIANATNMKVAQRGMYGYNSKEHVDDLTSLYNLDELIELGGIVDYLVGAKPGPGVFIYATTDDPLSKKYLRYGKLGDGPLYSFYVPYHLLFFETAISISRMIDFKDMIVSPIAGTMVEVVATTKVPMMAGERIDGLGGYKSYGVCENFDAARKENLLPMGLAEGSVVKHNVPVDHFLTFDDVTIPQDNLPYRLWLEQVELFK
jgi:predicted homoserine dehydrogenase-like protein